MKRGLWMTLAAAALVAAGCAGSPKENGMTLFKDDQAFLEKHTGIIVLTDRTGERMVAVSPKLQARVMTSSAAGPGGLSFGWINKEAIASGVNDTHMNAFGGEDRFWLGPEGGQFSLFFKKGDPFDLTHWHTPPAVNEESFETTAKTGDRVDFVKSIKLLNYSGTAFDIRVERSVRLLADEEVRALGIPVPSGIKMVAFSSENRITNAGREAWTRDKGLVSIWILGMFNPSEGTTIVVPFVPGGAAELGRIVNDSYFGKVPTDRLKVDERGVLFFSGDGRFRSKIGISPARVRPFAGSWDAKNGVLTIVKLTLPSVPSDYVNSMWEIQKKPFSGDVVNSYNDGPASPGAKPMGPFYELESSSPAAALAPGESMRHTQSTVHFRGAREALDGIARTVLGVGLNDIERSLAR